MAPGGLPANQAGSLRCYFKGQATKKRTSIHENKSSWVCLRSTREGFRFSACLQPSLQRRAAPAQPQPRCPHTPAVRVLLLGLSHAAGPGCFLGSFHRHRGMH